MMLTLQHILRIFAGNVVFSRVDNSGLYFNESTTVSFIQTLYEVSIYT